MKTNLAPAHFAQSQIALAATTDTTVLNEDTQRTYLAIQNTTAGILHVGFGAAASASTFQIAAGATWEPRTPPLDAIHLYAASAGTVTVITGQLSA